MIERLQEREVGYGIIRQQPGNGTVPPQSIQHLRNEGVLFLLEHGQPDGALGPHLAHTRIFVVG